jgi:hypothetical protein
MDDGRIVHNCTQLKINDDGTLSEDNVRRDLISSWRNNSRRNLEDSIILRSISRSTIS